MTPRHQTPKALKVITTLALVLPVAYLIFSFSNTSMLKPKLPVALSLRDAVLNSSMVLRLQNNGTEVLDLSATFENASRNKTKTAHIKLSPEKTKEYGFLEGWGFQPGDKIHLTHPDYATLNYKVPSQEG